MPGSLVTGASRGIGRAIARRYAADGHDVAVNYHTSADAAREVVDRIESETDARAIAVRGDVSDPDAAADCVEAAVEAFGGLAHLVNNAGINQHVHTPDLSPEEFDRVVNVNLDGTFHVTKAALPHLEAAAGDAETAGTGGDAETAGAAGPGGAPGPDPGPSVVNLSSRLAHAGADYEPHYAASKAGVVGLTKSHAAEFGPGIRVNAIAPGYIRTDMTDATTTPAEREERRTEIPVGRLGRPADVAAAAAYLRDAGFVTGATLDVNGGQRMR